MSEAISGKFFTADAAVPDVALLIRATRIALIDGRHLQLLQLPEPDSSEHAGLSALRRGAEARRADQRSEGLFRDYPVRHRARRLELVQRRAEDTCGHVTASCWPSFPVMAVRSPDAAQRAGSSRRGALLIRGPALLQTGVPVLRSNASQELRAASRPGHEIIRSPCRPAPAASAKW